MAGFAVAFCMLTPAFVIVGCIVECRPVKHWLNQLALGMPMLRNS